MAKDSYSAGNLEMQIQAVGTNATASLSSVNSQLKTMKNLVSSTSKTLSVGALLGKLYFIRNFTKQIGRGIANLVQNAIDYTETLNLWQVAMRNNRQEAEKFVSTMNKAYGISEQTLMNYQATFKNMLSALGGISEGTSYALSEYLTQMALDYASLYNTSIQRAMTVFQSVLSGQVRPIRSISGYDITETTIYQLYQQLGGEKTMRQLSQTEKRLLRIYAVFQQMENSGTIGDLNKTLGNSANQLRILSEGLKELGTWLGIIIEQWIRPILPYLNAAVITLKNIIKAIAVATGYKPFEGGIESANEYAEAMDNLTGKLLSFDRFEALNSSSDKNILGIDTALLDGLSKYESILAGVTNKATELAEKWTAWWVDADTGELTEKAKQLLDVLKSIGITIGVLIGYKLFSKVGNLLGKITGLTSGIKLLEFAILTGAVYAFIKAVEAFKEGDYWIGILATTIGVVLVGSLIALRIHQDIATSSILKTAVAETALDLRTKASIATQKAKINVLKSVYATSMLVAAGIGAMAMGISSLVSNWGELTVAERFISIFVSLAAAIAAAATALFAFKQNWIRAVAVGALVGGTAMAITSQLSSLKRYKAGGLVEDGIFTMNKGEMAGTFEDGSTIVANNQQIIDGIKQGVYSAVVSAMNQTGNRGGVGNVYLDGRKVGIATAHSSHNEMVRTSLVRANS